MKRILLPTDFSQAAHNAFAYAIGLYGLKDIKYILLHAYAEPQRRANVLISLLDILEEQARQGMQSELKHLQEEHHLPAGSIEGHVEYGTLQDVLKRFIAREKCDVIVMGTTGASGIKKLTLGSHTADVIRQTEYPVIAVPEHIRFAKPVNIAFAIDFKVLQLPAGLDPLTDLAQLHDSKLHVVNFGRNDSTTDTQRQREKEKLGVKLNGHLADIYESPEKNFLQGIQFYLQDQSIDLLAMISRKHTAMERLFRKSMTNEMAMLAKWPLLVMHAG